MLKEQFVQSSDRTQLYYEKLGSGQPVVLCDGLLCDGHVWKYLTPALEKDCELLHWHYPGHGKSGEPPRFADLSSERLGGDVAVVARDAGLPRITVVGHSLGVQVALETWRCHRELVEALILICGSPGHIVSNFHEGPILGLVVPVLDTIGHFVPGLLANAWQRLPAQTLTRLAMYTREVNSRLIKDSDLARYFSGLSRVDFRLALQMLKSAEQHDATPYLKEIDVPVLIIAGKEDRFTPPDRSEMMAKLIPSAEMLMVRGGTHSLPIEQPDLVNLRIRRFLATCRRRD
ncbi:MAG: alpha/beta hydrolase [Proteobacteria bacterium]|nr:alpha/beta hydrolase [Pseudomonadota bacterium]